MHASLRPGERHGYLTMLSDAALAGCRAHRIPCTLLPPHILDLTPPPADARLAYGDAPQQFGDLRLPKGAGPHPVAIVIHGGYWRVGVRTGTYRPFVRGAHARGRGHLEPGIPAYRRSRRRLAGHRRGRAARRRIFAELAQRYPLDLTRVVADRPLRGRATGAVARGAAPDSDARRGFAGWSRRSASRLGVGLKRGAVAELLGGTPENQPERYHLASPIELLPLGVPERLLHGTRDDVVPIEISRRFQAAAAAAGDDARLIELPDAGHFDLIDPRTRAWTQVEAAVRDLLYSTRLPHS